MSSVTDTAPDSGVSMEEAEGASAALPAQMDQVRAIVEEYCAFAEASSERLSGGDGPT